MVDKGRCQLQVGQVEERTNKGRYAKNAGGGGNVKGLLMLFMA